MGELAREQGYDSTYLATLYIPDLNIEQGAIKLDSLSSDTNGTRWLSSAPII